VYITVKNLFLLILIASSAFAATLPNEVLEVRPTNGNDKNGGGFVAGQAGTDMSLFNNKNGSGCTSCQSSSANLSATDASLNASAVLTSVNATFSSAIVGNVVYLELGGGSCVSGTINAQWRQVISTTGNTITLDVTPTGTPVTCTNFTINIGGALQTLATSITALGFATSPFQIYVKNESAITTTATLTFPASSVPSVTLPWARLEGYSSSRGDGGRVSLSLSTNTGLTAIVVGAGWQVANWVIDCASLGTSTGLSLGNEGISWNNKISNCVTGGVVETGTTSSYNFIAQTEITGCSGTAISLTGTYNQVIFNYIHDNTATAVNASASAVNITFRGNIVARNTGSTSVHGLVLATIGVMNVADNVFDSNGGDGLRITGNSAAVSLIVKGNIFYNNGVYGLDFVTATWRASYFYDGNAYGANSTAPRHNADDVSTNKLDAVAPYTNPLDVTGINDPWVNRTGGNYTLNSTAGAGALISSQGFPGAFGTGTTSTTGYRAIGPIQPQVGSTFVQVGYGLAN